MLLFSQSTGRLTLNGQYLATGYAGNGLDKNNPRSQSKKGRGPLPQGLYEMTGVHDSPNTGPYTIILTPKPETIMFGRGDFRIHGDKASAPGTASDGCICISPKSLRVRCYLESGKVLCVTA